MTRIKTLSGVGLAAAAVVLVVACSRESSQKQPVTTTTEKGSSTSAPANEVEKRDHALVRVIHAIPKGPALDVFADDQESFDRVSYKEVTPYKELPDKLQLTFAIKINGQDTGQPLAENSETISSGKHYTVVALPDSHGKPTLKVINDDLTPPRSDKAKVRFIHASPDAGEVDLVSKERNDALFGGVNFQSEVGYREVDPIRTTLEVRPEGKKNVLLAIPNTTLDAGKIYTIVIAGKTRTTPKLEAITIEDQLGSPTARLDSGASPTSPMSN
jgi:hypothetical protein